MAEAGVGTASTAANGSLLAVIGDEVSDSETERKR